MEKIFILIIVFFIFSVNLLAEQAKKIESTVKPSPVERRAETKLEAKKDLSAKVQYSCKGKLLSRGEVPADFYHECDKTIITLPSGEKTELINYISKIDETKRIFHEVKMIEHFLAFVDISTYEGGTGKIINLLNSKESYLISSNANPLFSPDKKHFFINGDFFNEFGGDYGAHLFTIENTKVIHEVFIRYENEHRVDDCLAKKCVVTSYLKDGLFKNFKWESNNKLSSSRCELKLDKNGIESYGDKCHNVWIEKVKDEWQVSWEKGASK